MKLNFKKLGEGKPLLILHGLFGSSDNWGTLGKKFSKNNSVYLIDLRNHGRSPHSNEMTYSDMANDLLELIKDEKIISPTILGHSMGGKVALMFAKNYPEYLEKLIVADIGLKAYPMHHEEILNGLNLKKLKFKTLNYDLFSEGLSIEINHKEIGHIGLVCKSIRDYFGIDQEVYGCIINIDSINKLNLSESFHVSEIPKFPFIQRDFALLLDKSISFNSIVKLSNEIEKNILESIDSLDLM